MRLAGAIMRPGQQSTLRKGILCSRCNGRHQAGSRHGGVRVPSWSTLQLPFSHAGVATGQAQPPVQESVQRGCGKGNGWGDIMDSLGRCLPANLSILIAQPMTTSCHLLLTHRAPLPPPSNTPPHTPTPH